MNVRRLLRANNFPHSDATSAWSQEILAEHIRALSDEERRQVLQDNVAKLCGISLAA